MSLLDFIEESNRIEGIIAKPIQSTIKAYGELLALDRVGIEDLEKFVGGVAPRAPLRRSFGMDVRVGNHIAPPGGPQVVSDLAEILAESVDGDGDPYETHLAYETLHPFMDGNGRSGRALWLWMMKQNGHYNRAIELGFLHLFYYQTLAAEGY